MNFNTIFCLTKYDQNQNLQLTLHSRHSCLSVEWYCKTSTGQKSNENLVKPGLPNEVVGEIEVIQYTDTDKSDDYSSKSPPMKKTRL